MTTANCIHATDIGKKTTVRCVKGHGMGGIVPIRLCNSLACADRVPVIPDPEPPPVAVTVHGELAIERWKRVEGPRLWAELHSRPAAYDGDKAAELAWLGAFSRRLPCGECKRGWKRLFSQLPPDFSSAFDYFLWGVRAHNAVNREIGKKELPETAAMAIYGFSENGPQRPASASASG